MKVSNRARIGTILAIVLVLIVPVQAFPMNLKQTNTLSSSETDLIKTWTALYYLDVDFNGAQNGDALELIFLDELASTDALNVLVLQDKEKEPAFLYYIDEHHQKILLEELGEVNMGDPQTIIDFISYAKEEYPAERYQFCPFGHASAWYGFCNDDTSGGDIVTMDEFKQALTATGGIDLLCFIGCCQMGSLECVYELKDLCEVYVASESSGHQNDWIGTLDLMCNLLSDNHTLSTVECGEQIVQFICDNTNENYDTLTISAIRTDKMAPLVTAFEQLCLYLHNDPEVVYEHLISARKQSKEYAFIQESCLIDVYDFVEKYREIETDENIVQILSNIQSNVSQALIAECHGDDQTGSHGLSIFYSSRDMISAYAHYNLDFTKDTHWDDLLDMHKKESGTFSFEKIFHRFYERFPALFLLLESKWK